MGRIERVERHGRGEVSRGQGGACRASDVCVCLCAGEDRRPQHRRVRAARASGRDGQDDDAHRVPRWCSGAGGLECSER